MRRYRISIDLHTLATGETHYYSLRFRADQLELLGSILGRQAANPDDPLTGEQAWMLIRLARAMVDAAPPWTVEKIFDETRRSEPC